MINIYTLHVSFIITSPKVKYTRGTTKCSRVGWRSRESKEEPGTKEEELACSLEEAQSTVDGSTTIQASKSEYANPKGQDI